MLSAKIKMAMQPVCAKKAISAHHPIAGLNVKSMLIVPTLWLALGKSVKIPVLASVVKTQNAMSKITMLSANV
jgi:hypothetical protein